jgi:hypothetical protein
MWRNWQTRMVQVHVAARPWRFKSSHPHQLQPSLLSTGTAEGGPDRLVPDLKVLTKQWVVPKQTLVLAPFDQIMELNCSSAETPALIEGAAKLNSAKNRGKLTFPTRPE